MKRDAKQSEAEELVEAKDLDKQLMKITDGPSEKLERGETTLRISINMASPHGDFGGSVLVNFVQSIRGLCSWLHIC